MNIERKSHTPPNTEELYNLTFDEFAYFYNNCIKKSNIPNNIMYMITKL